MSLRLWQRFNAHAITLPALFLFTLFLLCVILGEHLSPFSPFDTVSDQQLLPPSWFQQGQLTHLFGTDELGRDLLSRIIYGARFTIGWSAMVVLIALIAGFIIGALSAAIGGIVDIVIMRIMDVLLAIPSLLFAIILVSALGAGLSNSLYAVTLALLPHFVRSTRRCLREELTREYVAAARLDGAGGLSLLTQTLLPNLATPLIVQTTLALSTALLDITAIGFLGLGAQAPLPEWGALLYSAHDLIQVAPWTVIVPGGAIFLAVLSVNLIGDALRNALDPRGQHH